MQYVRKRDGELQKFDSEKIRGALFKAFRALGILNPKIIGTSTQDVVDTLFYGFGDKGVPTVEEIQDIIEKTLMEKRHFEVARAYILYRSKRAENREMAFKLEGGDVIDNYISEDDWQVKENANMTKSMAALNFHLSSRITKDYWLYRIYPPEIRKAHISGDLHIHDLGILGPYCVGWDLRPILKNGFPRGVSGKLTSGPAKHLHSALFQAMNALFTLQGDAAGAQAFSNFDTLMAPGIHYDQLDYDGTYQAIQGFIHAMNVSTRVGFQPPFTNLTMDVTIPKFMRDEPVTWAGAYKKDLVYGDLQDEMDMFNKAFCDVMSSGDDLGRIFSFPIPTYNITEDFNWDFPELWEMTTKYGIPYFSNFINSDMSPEDVRSMCCRLRIDNRELQRRGGGFFGANPLTGSIGVVTINLPRLGYLSRDEDEFFTRLERQMELARRSLILKKKIVEQYTHQRMYPYSQVLLQEIYDQFGEYWKNHFCTIGLIGMNEAITNLLGVDIIDSDGLEFASQTLEFMRDRLTEYQNEEVDQNGYPKFIYNLEATPGEGTTYRLGKIDKEKFPNIKVANEAAFRTLGAEPYYTNSTHLPVDSGLSLVKQIRHQDHLQPLYTGGTVMHNFFDEAYSDPEAIGRFVRKFAETSKIPYYTVTPTFSICPTHGHLRGEHFTCPKCHMESEVFSRIVGYYRPVKQWNPGKQAEYTQRVPLKNGIQI